MPENEDQRKKLKADYNKVCQMLSDEQVLRMSSFRNLGHMVDKVAIRGYISATVPKPYKGTTGKASGTKVRQ